MYETWLVQELCDGGALSAALYSCRLHRYAAKCGGGAAKDMGRPEMVSKGCASRMCVRAACLACLRYSLCTAMHPCIDSNSTPGTIRSGMHCGRSHGGAPAAASLWPCRVL